MRRRPNQRTIAAILNVLKPTLPGDLVEGLSHSVALISLHFSGNCVQHWADLCMTAGTHWCSLTHHSS